MRKAKREGEREREEGILPLGGTSEDQIEGKEKWESTVLLQLMSCGCTRKVYSKRKCEFMGGRRRKRPGLPRHISGRRKVGKKSPLSFCGDAPLGGREFLKDLVARLRPSSLSSEPEPI